MRYLSFFCLLGFFFFCLLGRGSALESCAVEPSWKTALYSLNYCNSACGYTGLPCVQQDTRCANYCAGTCCSYCVCDSCGEVSPSPAEQCGGSELNVVHDSDPLSTTSCDFHCKCPDYAGEDGYDFDTCTAPSAPCPDSDDDGLPDCCGGNLDCPDSDGDGIYDCCGDGAPCEDSDSDGVPDSCDPCPDDATVTKKEICVYKVESMCDGVGSYHLGDVCGTWTTSCGDSDGCVANGSAYIRENDTQCSFFCCEQERCDVVQCEVDPDTCEPKTCKCPNDEEACPECQAADCECPDGEEFCKECQLPKPPETCECPDGQDVCEQCQDPDCTCPDGQEVCQECQLPKPNQNCQCPVESPCAECQNPDCTCPDGQDYCQECQYPSIPPSGTGIPDAIDIGGCIIDLTEFKEFFSSGESFPINFLYAFYNILSPLYSYANAPSDLILSYNIAPDDDPNFSQAVVKFDLSEYPVLIYIAGFVRWAFEMTILITAIFYGLKRYHNVFGVSR